MNKELEFLIKNDNWLCISTYQKLTLDFIREFQDKVIWNYISVFQELTLDFIREFQDKVDWDYISRYQELTLDFVKEHMPYIKYKRLVQNKYLDQNAVKKIYEMYSELI